MQFLHRHHLHHHHHLLPLLLFTWLLFLTTSISASSATSLLFAISLSSTALSLVAHHELRDINFKKLSFDFWFAFLLPFCLQFSFIVCHSSPISGSRVFCSDRTTRRHVCKGKVMWLLECAQRLFLNTWFLMVHVK